MHPLSVIIPCKNEQRNIGDCIRSLQDLADEIIIADNGSTDATLEIVAQIGGCRVIEREFIGYANFKNWALPQARHEWVLVVDADERLTPELVAEIRTLLSGEPACDAYAVRREDHFLGHRIRYCGWSTPETPRLVRKSVCRYDERLVHEAILVATGKVGSLRHRLLHFTARDLEAYIRKLVRYGCLDGDERFGRGARPNYVYTLGHAPLRFLQLYLIRGGFRDGFPGLILCMLLAFYVFIKDARIWERHDPVAVGQARDPYAGPSAQRALACRRGETRKAA